MVKTILTLVLSHTCNVNYLIHIRTHTCIYTQYTTYWEIFKNILCVLNYWMTTYLGGTIWLKAVITQIMQFPKLLHQMMTYRLMVSKHIMDTQLIHQIIWTQWAPSAKPQGYRQNGGNCVSRKLRSTKYGGPLFVQI